MKISRILVFLSLMTLASMVWARPDCDKIRNDERLCMACNIYHEAAVEPYLGQLGVAYVTSNRRLNSFFPNNYCGVVWDYITTRKGKRIAQFSWTKDGASDRVRAEVTWQRALKLAAKFTLPNGIFEEMCPQVEATRRMRQILKEEYGIDRTNLPPATCPQYEANLRMKLIVLEMSEPDPTSGATNYHATYVNPRWASHETMRKTIKISQHIFYVDTKIAPEPEKRL